MGHAHAGRGAQELWGMAFFGFYTEFILLACDGLWDVADNEMVAELVRKHTEAAGLKGAACALTTFAIKNGSSDNVT